MVIGLDGATLDLIKPWAERGKLPTFKKIIDGGVYGNLSSTIPAATIPAWPSLITGTNPGKHGFFDFWREMDNSYELTVEIHPSRAIKQPTLWKILSNYKKKVAVINVPSTYPPSKVNGYMITGMLTPPGAKFTYPSELEVELTKNIGRYNTFFSALSAKNPDKLLEDLENTLETRLKAVEYLWIEKKPDFLMFVDNGTDRAEHELWRFLDTLNPLYYADSIRRFSNPLLRYFQALDRALQRIMDLLDEHTILIIVSDHGQGPLRKFININMFLIKEGFMVIKRNIKSRLRFLVFNHGFTPRNLYNILRKLGFERYATDKISPKTRLSLLNRLFFSTHDIEWSKTKAFASGVTGAITINVKGRQHLGIVKQGEMYRTVRNEIIKKVHELKDTETGCRVISDVFKREEIYKGRYLDKAPDIIVRPSEGYEFFGMFSFSFNQIIEPTFGNSGSHRPNGIFMAMGKGIRKGVELKRSNIIDVTPTILHTMNIPLPLRTDGRVLKEIFEDDNELIRREVKYQEKCYESERIRKIIKRL